MAEIPNFEERFPEEADIANIEEARVADDGTLTPLEVVKFALGFSG